MPSHCYGPRSIVRIALSVAFLHASLPASAQILDGFIPVEQGFHFTWASIQRPTGSSWQAEGDAQTVW